mgnify:CR=1 FL=1
MSRTFYYNFSKCIKCVIKGNMIRENFTLNTQIAEKLNKLKQLTGLTKSDIVRRAIEKLWSERKREEKKELCQ